MSVITLERLSIGVLAAAPPLAGDTVSLRAGIGSQ